MSSAVGFTSEGDLTGWVGEVEMGFVGFDCVLGCV
jgi:hypothetical protein